MGIVLEAFGRAGDQRIFDGARRLAWCQPGAVADAEHMRIHRDGRFAEGDVEHDVGGLAAHAGQGFQRLAIRWHFAAVLIQQDAAGAQDVLRLGVVQADGADVLLQFRFTEFQQAFRCVGDLEQRPGGLVDAHVRGLGREDHRDQQLEGRAVDEFGLRSGIGFLQATEDRHAGFRGHRAVSVCAE